MREGFDFTHGGYGRGWKLIQEAAKALGVERGTALLSLTRLAFENRHSQDFPVDYLRVLYHPERFEYRIDLDLGIDG